MQRFHKIDFGTFKTEVKDDSKLYDRYLIPAKKKQFDSEYIFKAPYKIKIQQFGVAYIPTGSFAKMNENETLILFPLNDLKYGQNIRFAYDSEVKKLLKTSKRVSNLHLFIRIQNDHNKSIEIEKAQNLCSLTFAKYVSSTNENIDFNAYDSIIFSNN